MAGSRQRCRLQRQRQRADAAARRDLPPKPVPGAEGPRASLVDLPPELLAEIHCRLDFVDRLNLAKICGAGASWHRHKTEAPCLVLPGATTETATLFSVAERQAAAALAPDPAMRGHVVLGSSDGWLVTVDLRAALRLANPVTGEHAELPSITTGTIPFVQSSPPLLDMELFAQVRLGGELPDYGSGRRPPLTIAEWQMRKWFYRKVVLSASPRPHKYAAMLILEREYGAPAFATADDPAWRLAPSRDGVEDAIYHHGRFYSITYSGIVEAWDRHGETGEFTSMEVGVSLPGGDDQLRRRKYIAAAPDGGLMVLLKDSKKVDFDKQAPVFEVQVLDEARGKWVATRDIGELALFVGVNSSLCVSTKDHSGIRPGCIYYTQDELGQASLRLEEDRYRTPYAYGSSIDGDRRRNYELQDLGVYVLKDGTVGRVEGLGRYRTWPLPAWFTPSV